jgi:hypothetical protein
MFLGANPPCVSYAGRPVSRPLGPEEDLVRALLDAIGLVGRDGHQPGARRHPQRHQPPRRARHRAARRTAGRLGLTARALLAQLVALYLDRLPAEVAAREAASGGAAGAALRLGGPADPGRAALLPGAGR